MKRSDALAPLSRDHHQGLFVALQLKRASAESAAAARQAFLDFFEHDGRLHFRLEEELLLPAFARHGAADHEAVVTLLTDHVELRRLADDLAAGPAGEVDLLHVLGERLERHIRHEERVLFPMVEEALPDIELEQLGVAIRAAEAGA